MTYFQREIQNLCYLSKKIRPAELYYQIGTNGFKTDFWVAYTLLTIY